MGYRASTRPGKSLSLSETLGLGHPTGMKVSLRHWRGPGEIIRVLTSGGSQAGKKSWPTRTWLCRPRCWASSGKSLGLSALRFPFGKRDAQHIFPDSVSWGSDLTRGSVPVPSVRQE